MLRPIDCPSHATLLIVKLTEYLNNNPQPDNGNACVENLDAVFKSINTGGFNAVLLVLEEKIEMANAAIKHTVRENDWINRLTREDAIEIKEITEALASEECAELVLGNLGRIDNRQANLYFGYSSLPEDVTIKPINPRSTNSYEIQIKNGFTVYWKNLQTGKEIKLRTQGELLNRYRDKFGVLDLKFRCLNDIG